MIVIWLIKFGIFLDRIWHDCRKKSENPVCGSALKRPLLLCTSRPDISLWKPFKWIINVRASSLHTFRSKELYYESDGNGADAGCVGWVGGDVK